MADITHTTAHGATMMSEIMPENLDPAAGDRNSTRDQAQQGGFSRPVRPAEQNSLADRYVERSTAQSRVSSEVADGVVHHHHVAASHAPRLVPPRSWTLSAFSFTGKLLIWIGVLLMGFAGYQLWGTNLAEASSQNKLDDEFAKFLAETAPPTAPSQDTAPPTTVPVDPTAPTTTVAPATTVPLGPPPVVLPGAAVARIEIPKIGVDKVVVSGVGVADLRRAPGHYTTTPMPGEPGNAGIAGHRTTYGAPFNRLDELSQGDEIFVTTRSGRFVYKVRTLDIVSPRDRTTLLPTEDNRLTLTTCHPKFSARQRLIVVADLMSTPVPLGSTVRTTREDTVVDVGPQDDGLSVDGEEQSTVVEPDQTSVDDSESGSQPVDQTQDPQALQSEQLVDDVLTEQDQAEIALGGDKSQRVPALIWALTALAVWVLAWKYGKRGRRVIVYAIAVAPFVFALFEFYARLALVLPGNVS
jgi:sortase A